MTATRTNHRLLVLLGFSGLLLSVLLVWSKFSHFLYAGLDGNLFQFTIETFLQHTQPFSVNAINIFQGLGSPLIQMNVWLNPGYLVFSLFNAEVARVASAAIFLFAYSFSTFFLARALGLSTLSAIIAGQLAAIVFPPFQYSVGLGIQFVLNPGVTYHIALLTFILCIVLRISSPSWITVIANACAIAALYAYSVYCDPLWTVVISVAFIIPFAICIFANGNSSALRGRVLSLALAAFLLYGLGIFHYIFSIAGFTARQYFQAEVFGEVQTGRFVSVLFQSQRAGFIYWLLFCGWIFGLIFAAGKRRLFALICLIYMLCIFGLGASYLFLNINWNYPVPIYFEQSIFHLYIVGAVGGWVSLISYYKALILGLHTLICSTIRRFTSHINPAPIIKHNWSAICSIVERIDVASTMKWAAVLIIPAIIFCYFLKPPPSWRAIYREKPPHDIGFVQYLQQEVGITSNQPFRGSVVLPSLSLSNSQKENFISPYERIRILHTLWKQGIPTMEIYGQMVPPPYYYFVSRLLNSSTEPIGRNGVGVSVLNLPALQILGIKFIASERSITSTDAILRKINKTTDGATWHLYELRNPNTGNYAPSRIYVSTNARESIEKMRLPEFNFEKDAVVSEKIALPLVPTRNTGFSFQDGHIHVWGESDGYSLMVLPVQYSKCLGFSEQDKAQIRRVNLTLTGVLFYKKIDASIRQNISFFSSECKLEDIRDLKLLKFDPEKTRSFPGQQPYAITELKDMKRQFTELLGEFLP